MTIFCAAHAAAPPEEVIDRVRYVRRGSKLSVYPAGMAALRRGLLGSADVVVDVQNGLPFFSRLVTRAPVVVLVHHVHREQWPVVGPVLARIGWFLESKVAVRANRGNRYLAVSEVTRSELVSLGVRAGDIQIAYNGLPRAPVREPVPASETPRIVVLSRLVPHKQIEHAIELMPQLLERYPDATLQVLGSGWWHDNLVAVRDRLGLHHHVVFHGHVTEEEKFAELERAWVHVLPSLKEGWGLSIIEAASVGTPSVAYRSAGGVQESILEDVTGLLADDRAQLAQQVSDLLGDAERRHDLGAKAQARSEHFSWDATTVRVAEQLFGEESDGSGAGHSSA